MWEESNLCMLRSLLSIWHILEDSFVYSQVFTLYLLVVGNTDTSMNKMEKKKKSCLVFDVFEHRLANFSDKKQTLKF